MYLDQCTCCFNLVTFKITISSANTIHTPMPHRIMDGQDREVYEAQSLQLRADLKQWEGDWAVAHAGKKPGRDDIKQNPDIAQKYKQYNKLRDILAGKIPPPPSGPVEATHGHQQQHQQQQRKRTRSDAVLPPQTPSKRPRPERALQKTQQSYPEDMSAATRTPLAAHVGTPSSNRTSFTPLAPIPTSISPTPQRDGRVLGIFDLLGRTPSRSTATVAKANTLPIAATPSKQRTADLLPTATTAMATTITTPSTARFAATTPQSKRTTAQLLFQAPASATTPRRRRRGSRGSITDGEGGKENTTPFKTPSANRVTKTRPNNNTAATPTSATPSFLRRRTISLGTAAAAGLARVDEQDEPGGGAGQEGAGEEDGDGDGEGGWGRVGPLRLPRKLGGLERSLSSVVAGLRRIQDEAFEEEEDALREMEMEMEGGGGGGAEKRTGRKDVAEEVEVGDSEAPAQLGRDLPPKTTHQEDGDAPAPLLSGFDEEALYDSLDEEKQRQPLRQFKKRGQKRSTRLVNMRPTRAKRPAQVGGEPDEEEEELDLVPETQFDASKPTTTAGGDADDLRLSDLDSASEADFHASGSDEENNEPAKTKAKAKKPKAAAANDKKTKAGGEAKGEGVVKRAVRKVKATAHANFKRLKLRNSGSKGGPAHNSRFRRRR
ncbi:DNA replication/checkpoint protein [Chaetomium tenue]|uniref:DNA replication/checkpoint protein n=1 Tax=Chaetomium tenue TaxID=1854479 RepID=A0ACB7P162_9PEZI|nr:DNA replication/checkpoint protein [Chaetomium globosum]